MLAADADETAKPQPAAAIPSETVRAREPPRRASSFRLDGFCRMESNQRTGRMFGNHLLVFIFMPVIKDFRSRQEMCASAQMSRGRRVCLGYALVCAIGNRGGAIARAAHATVNMKLSESESTKR